MPWTSTCCHENNADSLNDLYIRNANGNVESKGLKNLHIVEQSSFKSCSILRYFKTGLVHFITFMCNPQVKGTAMRPSYPGQPEQPQQTIDKHSYSGSRRRQTYTTYPKTAYQEMKAEKDLVMNNKPCRTILAILFS